MNHYSILRFCAPALIGVGVLFSCTANELEEVLEFKEEGIVPARTTTDVAYTFTDSGKVKNLLEAGRVDQYVLTDTSYSEISNGFSLTFYTSTGDFDGRLTARNASISGDNSKMIARDSVVFVNRNNETLNTEELYWISDSAKVFTDKFVKIEREDIVIYGKGLNSNENFTNYEIREPTGLISIHD